MKKVCCFGELLLRMSPSLNGEWIRRASMPVYVGGAELNVANALAKWNVPVKYCTALPGNFLSKEICDDLRKKNIDVSSILFSGGRIGIYYLTQGTDLKNTGVIYDRAHSSFCELQPGRIDWNEVLHDVSWFHCSAISSALNENAAKVCKEGLVAASKKGITVSIDLNYRAKLWQYDKLPVEIMPSLVNECDIVMGNIWSANSLLGIEVDQDIHERQSKTAYLEHASQTAKIIMQRFPKCKTVANTFRFDNESSIKYYAALNNDIHQFVSKEFNTTSAIDKVGSGDCFMAGLIYGLYHHIDGAEVINFAAAAAFGKLHEAGDATNQDINDITSKINSHG